MEQINSELIRYLDYCRATLKLDPINMRVLDYGCGSGQSVLSLRLSGYKAFGVDIDKEMIIVGQNRLIHMVLTAKVFYFILTRIVQFRLRINTFILLCHKKSSNT